MRRRLLALVAAFAAVPVPTASAAAPVPQIVDPAGDANGGVYWASDPDHQTAVGSQPYADVTSVAFRTTTTSARRTARVTGFTVTMRLSAPPEPPADMVAVYRVLGFAPGCLFGLDHYTSPVGSYPQSAIVTLCGERITRTPIAPPAVDGTALTWTVPLAAIPRALRVGVGTTLTELHFEVALRANGALCASDPPGEEQEPCAVMADTTFRRTGKYTVR